MGLLRVLATLRPALDLRLWVAHLDHGVRGDAAREDAQFVKGLANSLGLAVDMKVWKPETMANFEAEARRVRYDWLISVARARGASVVAVGHTLDDQAETILHRIVRGTGPTGLRGMSARRKLWEDLWLIRPLLDVPRAEIRLFLRAIGQTWQEDATNADVRQTRARIRQEILPELASLNSKVNEALVRLGRLAGEEHRTLATLLDRRARRVRVSREAGQVKVDLEKLQNWPNLVRIGVLRRIWNQVGLPERGMSEKHWRALGRISGREGSEAGRSLRLPGGLRVERFGARLEIGSGARNPERFCSQQLTVTIPGETGGDGWVLKVGFDLPEPDECVDAEAVQPFGEPEAAYLEVRGAQEGDRFDPLGMGGHSMPLADFFRGRRVPQTERARVP
ncbi:MAG TPA: tRNA lysidine(34) synthetase TilS, partial [Isosphaeraceae bacterium]|nr:tRNA lysidine(34) synthetase TilS [Isosphaeraceae bacterium]